MITRYFVIALAFVGAGLRAKAHAWAETIGLSALGAGLILLRVADLKQLPVLRKIAWVLFAVTLVSLGMVFERDYLR